MGRFTTTSHIDCDPEMVKRAADLHERAAVLMAAGKLPADYKRQCFSLSDLRKMVESAEVTPMNTGNFDPGTAYARLSQIAIEESLIRKELLEAIPMSEFDAAWEKIEALDKEQAEIESLLEDYQYGQDDQRDAAMRQNGK